MTGSLTIWENLGYKFGSTTSSVVCSVNIVCSERYDVVEFEANWNGGDFHSFRKKVIQVCNLVITSRHHSLWLQL